eukprot:779324-Prymnesium_polylepis.2
MGLLTDSRAGAGEGSARTGDVTRGRDHSTLCQPTRATWARRVHHAHRWVSFRTVVPEHFSRSEQWYLTHCFASRSERWYRNCRTVVPHAFYSERWVKRKTPNSRRVQIYKWSRTYKCRDELALC